jgi:uncharacterized membrane protein
MCSLQKMTSEKELKKLLPWYINHTLSPIENEEIEYWLQISTKSIQQTANEYQQIALGVTKQTNHLPKPEIREKLLTRINEPVRTFTISRWAIGISLALTIFFLLFLIFHPGIELKWTML